MKDVIEGGCLRKKFYTKFSQLLESKYILCHDIQYELRATIKPI